MTKTTPKPSMKDALDEVFASEAVPSFSRVLACAEAAQQAFLTELGTRIRAPMNEYLSTQPQRTFEEKRSLAAALNAQLAQFKLAIKHPETGEATVIAVERNDDGQGYFLFPPVGSTVTSAEATFERMPELTLIASGNQPPLSTVRRAARLEVPSFRSSNRQI
jgi:hypothetical protein